MKKLKLSSSVIKWTLWQGQYLTSHWPLLFFCLWYYYILFILAIYNLFNNYMFCVNPPWRDRYDLPKCYKEYDAPAALPKTKGIGTMKGFLIRSNMSKRTLIVIY